MKSLLVMLQRRDNAIGTPADVDVHKQLLSKSSNNTEAFNLRFMW